jgi:Carboxypeptidase regulatory-like domain
LLAVDEGGEMRRTGHFYGRALAGAVGIWLALGASPAAGAAIPVWGTVDSPNQGDRQNVLLGVKAFSFTDVWVVGEWNPGVPPTETGRRTLTEHWDGTAFTIFPSPNADWPGVDKSTLEGVSGVSSRDVWAVGFAEDFASLKSTTLTERWDGTAWRLIPSPNPAGDSLPNRLYSVAAVSSNNVWAVGEVEFPGKALTLRWNGSAWQVVPNACRAPLQDVTAVRGLTVDLWAVGGATACRLGLAGWRDVPTPPPTPGEAWQLQDVSGSSSRDVWAVGYRAIPFGEHVTFAPLIEHWDGRQWSVNPFVPGQLLYGVKAIAPNDAWAVGTDGARQIILHWDGSSWSRVPTPSPGGGRLLDVEASGPADLWAAGWFSDRDFRQRTLVEQAPSRTQGTVLGHTNVSGALITWFGPVSGSTETDPFGDYDVAGLTAGTYDFIASADGCQPDFAEVTVIAGQETVQDFHIEC